MPYLAEHALLLFRPSIFNRLNCPVQVSNVDSLWSNASQNSSFLSQTCFCPTWWHPISVISLRKLLTINRLQFENTGGYHEMPQKACHMLHVKDDFINFVKDDFVMFCQFKKIMKILSHDKIIFQIHFEAFQGTSRIWLL